jgi:hypothetical protein
MFSSDTCFRLNGFVSLHQNVFRYSTILMLQLILLANYRDMSDTWKHSSGTSSWKDWTPKDISGCWMLCRKRKWTNCLSQYDIDFNFSRMGNHLISLARCQLLDGLGAGDQLVSHQDLKPLHVSYGVVWSRLCTLHPDDHEASYYKHHNSNFKTCAMQCAASFQPVRATERTSISFPSLMLWPCEAGYCCVFYLYRNIIIQFPYVRVTCNRFYIIHTE